MKTYLRFENYQYNQSTKEYEWKPEYENDYNSGKRALLAVEKEVTEWQRLNVICSPNVYQGVKDDDGNMTIFRNGKPYYRYVITNEPTAGLERADYAS